MTIEEAIEGLKSWLDTETQILESDREDEEIARKLTEGKFADMGKKIYEKLLNNIKESERHVEMFRMAIEALEKQTPKKPIEIKETEYYLYYDCPSCGYSLYFDLEHVPDYYCRRCGQKIDWSEE